MLTPFPHGLLFYTSMIYIRLTPISSLDQHEEKQTHWTDHHWSAVASLLALLCAPLSHVPSQQVPGPLSANWSNNRWCNSCIDMTMRDKGTNGRCSVRSQLQWLWYLTPVQSASQSSFLWCCLSGCVTRWSHSHGTIPTWPPDMVLCVYYNNDFQEVYDLYEFRLMIWLMLWTVLFLTKRDVDR